MHNAIEWNHLNITQEAPQQYPCVPPPLSLSSLSLSPRKGEEENPLWLSLQVALTVEPDEFSLTYGCALSIQHRRGVVRNSSHEFQRRYQMISKLLYVRPRA